MLNDMSISLKNILSRAFDYKFLTKVEYKTHFFSVFIVFNLLVFKNLTVSAQSRSGQEDSFDFAKPNSNSSWTPQRLTLFDQTYSAGLGFKYGMMDIEKNVEQTYYLNFQYQKFFRHSLTDHYLFEKKDYALDGEIQIFLNGLISLQASYLLLKENDYLSNILFFNSWNKVFPKYYYYKVGINPIIHTSGFMGGFLDYQRYFVVFGIGASHYKWLPQNIQTEFNAGIGVLGWNIGLQINYLISGN